MRSQKHIARMQDADSDNDFGKPEGRISTDSMVDSNLEPERKNPPPQSKSEENSPGSPDKASRRPLFGSLNKDLKQALDTWETLTEQMDQKISPEEEQLREVKRLLGELKSKLSQFED